jgi:nucleotide-binding universal stress UspA family protein
MIPKIQKILYATDLSPNSVYALRYAMNSAMKHGAEIIILHVLEKLDPARHVMLDFYEERYQKLLNEHLTKAKDIIKNQLEKLREQEIKDHPEFSDIVISIKVCDGYPAEKILSKAQELNCDEIIMGTHSKGIIANTFLGSVAKRVLRRTRKPVFIIPLPKAEVDIALPQD